MSVVRIKKDDTVVAIRGADVGKTGKVIQVLPDKNRALIEGLNLVKKTLRKSQDNPQGGIAEKEAPLHLSNVMPYCPHCKKGVKIRCDRDEGKKVRKCKICGHAFDG